ncbi:MAG: sporulation protein [Nitrospina sp.]|jgi:cell fate regulator YaaT (PSP1 superfamily)|nr:sporulation protein [Nitrospina sp.]
MSETLKEDATLAKNNSKKPSFLIGVRIEGAAKSKLYDPGKQNYRVGSRVVVESDYGGQMGIIVSNKIPNVIKTESKTYRVLRTFNKNDIQVQTRKNETEKRAKKVCQEIIKKLKLSMNLSRVNFLQNEKKIIFFFTAEGRVDFRQLIKELVPKLKQRIEMKQMGVRDEARAIKGYGVCGETLCCSTFLEDFTSVTIKMAKDQGLALNPSKISGACGRLMCCLQYEHQTYKELSQAMPKLGSTIQTPDGAGKVIQSNILQQRVLVRLEDESITTFSMEELSLS